MKERLGDLKLYSFIHPDSLNQRVWEVEQLKLATGKYAEEGQTYWSTIFICTSEEEAHKYIYPVTHSLWEHKKGNVYRVLMLTNMTATDGRYPKTISYENIDTGERYSRPLKQWHSSMTPLVDCTK